VRAQSVMLVEAKSKLRPEKKLVDERRMGKRILLTTEPQETKMGSRLLNKVNIQGPRVWREGATEKVPDQKKPERRAQDAKEGNLKNRPIGVAKEKL